MDYWTQDWKTGTDSGWLLRELAIALPLQREMRRLKVTTAALATTE